MFPSTLNTLSSNLLKAYGQRKVKLVTAESCTGGLIAAMLTEIPGSSLVVERGFVTYCNESKTEMLGVSTDLIKQHGAVSEEVAKAMAIGALQHSSAQISVAVTGIAGPDGGTPKKPVGLVYIACASQQNVVCERHIFKGNRSEVRLASCENALRLLAQQLH